MRRGKIVFFWRARNLWTVLLCLSIVACAGVETPKSGNASGGLITTPVSYYSTPKARMLGQKYQVNLERIIERIARNPKTSGLQFSNNIASVGGIGFFTHAAASVPDERYLEVVLSAPELLDASDDSIRKLRRLFSLYGNELLAILAADGEIYQDRDVGGYGLNLSWRKFSGEGKSSRMVIERGVAYFAKSHVRGYLRREISENDLLKNAVVFVAENDRPMTVVSIQPQELRTDFRPPIVEENIAEKPVLPDVEQNIQVVKQPEPQIPPMPIAQPALQDSSPPPAPLIVMVPPETSSKIVPPDASSPFAKKSSVNQPQIEAQMPQAEKALPVNERTYMPVVKQPEQQPPPMPIAQPALQDSSLPSAPLIVVVAPETSQKTVAPDTSSSAAKSSSVKQAEIEPQMPPPEKTLPVNERPSAPLIVVLESPQPVAIPTEPAVVSKGTADSSQETTSKVAMQAGPTPEVPPQAAAAQTKKQSDVVAQQKTPADLPTSIVRREETPGRDERSNDSAITRGVEQPPAEYARRVEKSTPEVASQPIATQTARTNNSAISTSAEAVAPKTPPREASSKPIISRPVQPAESLPVIASAPLAEAPKRETKPSSQEIVSSSIEEQALRSVIRAPVIPETVALPPIISLPEQQAVSMADNAKPQKDLPVNPVLAKEATLVANTSIQKTPSNEPTTNAASETIAAPQEIVQSEPSMSVRPRKAEGEQLASLGSKPTESVEPKKPAVRPVPKPLSGYIVQIAFADSGSAQRWAESMERRGFAVSVTDAGDAGGVRVRLGNFAARDQAERQLQMLRQDGLKGMVLNLPQAFRPEARASMP